MPCKRTTWDCIAQHVNSHVQAIAWEFTWFHHVSLFGKHSKMRTKHPESLCKRLTPPQATFKTASENETSNYLINSHSISQPWFRSSLPWNPIVQLQVNLELKISQNTSTIPISSHLMSEMHEPEDIRIQPQLPPAATWGPTCPLKPVTSVGVGL